jgi:hypothetical protein
MASQSSFYQDYGAYLAQQDMNWQGAVFHFIQHHSPAAVTPPLREWLADLAQAFFTTSGGIAMQSLLVALDGRYNLTGMLDDETLFNIRCSVADHAAMITGQQQQTYQSYQPYQPYQQQNQLPRLPSPSPVLILPLPSPSPALPAATPTTTLTSPEPDASSPVPVIPAPGSTTTLVLRWRQPDWAYICDLCGHALHDRPDLHRHMRIGALRTGFRTKGETFPLTELETPQWHGVDEDGNEFSGAIVTRTKNTGLGQYVPPKAKGKGKDKGKGVDKAENKDGDKAKPRFRIKEQGKKRDQPAIPLPCGPRIVAFEKPGRELRMQKYREEKAKKMAVMAAVGSAATTAMETGEENQGEAERADEEAQEIEANIRDGSEAEGLHLEEAKAGDDSEAQKFEEEMCAGDEAKELLELLA